MDVILPKNRYFCSDLSQIMKKNFSEESYSKAVEALLSASPSFGTVGKDAYKPGLQRSMAMDKILGSPSVGLQCIHVAGTNGKGSVCNMLASCIAASGKKVGLYTSPHILDFRERIRTVGNDGFSLVPKEWVFDFLVQYGRQMEDLGLSFFEITTAMCLKYFAEQKVDMAIIETGLGGRLDATNIITPVLSVITNIGYDHMDILGDTLGKIAAEKAGIIKAGVPVVVGERNEETDPVFVEFARKCGSVLHFAGDFDMPENRGEALPSLERMDLKGIYQEKNLRTVACALHVCGIKLEAEALENAAHICGFHGRWEKIMDEPYTICDIGHNEHGLKYNFSQLEKMLSCGEVSDIVMVYGSVKDKDVDAVLRLLPRRAHIVFTAAENPRAMSAAELFERYSRIAGSLGVEQGCPCCIMNPGVAAAVASAMEKCRRMDKPLLYIGGSTYIVSEALRCLGIRF